MGVGADVAHCAVIHDVGAPVRSEPDIERTVEARRMARGTDERLITGVIAGKPSDLESKRLVSFRGEVDELDLVSHFGRRFSGVWRREPEISLERIKRRAVFHRTTDKRPGHEVDRGERRIRRLDRQR